MPKIWEIHFPNLGEWTETSEETRQYNCFAFAVGDMSRRWEPQPPGIYYWPPGVNRGYDAASFLDAYKTEGFRQCADGSLVEGREKIALFLNRGGGVEHVARQLPDGRWTSKIGDHEDIAHGSPESLISDDYGYPRCFMEREIKIDPSQTKETDRPISSASSDDRSPAQSRAINPRHREDFTALLNAAGQKRLRDDQT